MAQRSTATVKQAQAFLVRSALEHIKNKEVSLSWFNAWVMDVTALVTFVDDPLKIGTDAESVEQFGSYITKQKSKLQWAIDMGATPFPTLGELDLPHFRYFHYGVVPLGILRIPSEVVDGNYTKYSRIQYLLHDLEGHLIAVLFQRGIAEPIFGSSLRDHASVTTVTRDEIGLYYQNIDGFEEFYGRFLSLAEHQDDKQIKDVLIFFHTHEFADLLKAYLTAIRSGSNELSLEWEKVLTASSSRFNNRRDLGAKMPESFFALTESQRKLKILQVDRKLRAYVQIAWQDTLAQRKSGSLTPE